MAGHIARYVGAGLVIGPVSRSKKATSTTALGDDQVILREDFLQCVRALILRGRKGTDENGNGRRNVVI